jgi:hypothetical protein
MFLLILVTSIKPEPLSNNAFAASPSFERQEIQNNVGNVLQIDDTNHTIIKLNDNSPSTDNITAMLANAIDINRVSYFSDGKVLNATIWLRNGFNATQLINNSDADGFGILVDVNPKPGIGIGGVSYHKEVLHPRPIDLPYNSTNFWIEDIHESVSYGPHRYMKLENNYNYKALFQQEMHLYPRFVYYIPLSLDLNLLVSPAKYKVMFYTEALVPLYKTFYTSSGIKMWPAGNDIRLIDFTSWIDIPPPTFNLSASSPVEIRRGDTQDVGVVLKSTAGSPNVVRFTNLQNHSGIQIITPKGKLNEVANSAAPTSFNITVPENTQVGEYTIPILADISSNSTVPKEFIGAASYHSNVPSESFITTVADLTIKILEPLGFSEWFKEGWDVYGSFIGLVAGGFSAGVASLLFDRLKNRNRNDVGQYMKYSSKLKDLGRKNGSPF